MLALSGSSQVGPTATFYHAEVHNNGKEIGCKETENQETILLKRSEQGSSHPRHGQDAWQESTTERHRCRSRSKRDSGCLDSGEHDAKGRWIATRKTWAENREDGCGEQWSGPFVQC